MGVLVCRNRKGGGLTSFPEEDQDKNGGVASIDDDDADDDRCRIPSSHSVSRYRSNSMIIAFLLLVLLMRRWKE